MEIKINDLILGGSQGYQIQAPIVGLEKAPIRISYGNYSGRDGGYVSSQFYSPREIIINGFYIGKTCDHAQQLRRDLTNALKIRETIPIYITGFNGDQYLVEAYVSDFKMDLISDRSGVYQITVISPDPYLYGAGDGENPDSGYIVETISKAIGGGYIFPYVLPVTWESSSQSTIIDNDTVIEVFPEIILTGKFTNPKITNVTTGEFIKINTVTSSLDTIKIDMKNREITLNGGSIAAYRTNDSTWWGLEPGENEIVLETDDTADEMTGILKWRKVYEGI